MAVNVADCGVQGCVAFDAGDGVAFEAGLVEEGVDYFVYQTNSQFWGIWGEEREGRETYSSRVMQLRGRHNSPARTWSRSGAWRLRLRFCRMRGLLLAGLCCFGGRLR